MHFLTNFCKKIGGGGGGIISFKSFDVPVAAEEGLARVDI